MWIGIIQLNQLKYRSLAGTKRPLVSEGSSKDSKSQRLISDMFMKKSEVLKSSLGEIETIISEPSQMFHVFETLMMLQEHYNELKNKKEELQEKIHFLQIINLDLIIEHSTVDNTADTFQYLMNVDSSMQNYVQENDNDFSKHYNLKKMDFDTTVKNVKEIYEILNDPNLFDEEDDVVPSTPHASSSGNPTTPGSGHSRESPLSWSIYKKNRPSRRASPSNKWSPLDPNKVSNTLVKTPSKAFDLSYFSVVLYELEEDESKNKKEYWRSVLSNKEYREQYFSPVHPHHILQASTLTKWDWSMFNVHQIRTIQHFSFLLSQLYESPTVYRENLEIFLQKFTGDNQIDEACHFCQYCENQEPQPLENEDKVIKYIFNNESMIENEKHGANFRSFLSYSPLEWLLVDDEYNEDYIKKYSEAVLKDYEVVYKIFHNTNFGDYIYENSVKEFVTIYEYFYNVELDNDKELMLLDMKEKLSYNDEEQPEELQKKIKEKTIEYLNFEPKDDWELFQKLSECFI